MGGFIFIVNNSAKENQLQIDSSLLLMMYRLQRYDVMLAHNDAARFSRNDAMFAQKHQDISQF